MRSVEERERESRTLPSKREKGVNLATPEAAAEPHMTVNGCVAKRGHYR